MAQAIKTGNDIRLPRLVKKSNDSTKNLSGFSYNSDGIKIHKHIVITGYIKTLPKSEEELSLWMREMVTTIDMELLLGPIVAYCGDEGNKGHTGIAAITTSHMAIHIWEECYPHLVELDIFSCKNFDVSKVVEKLNQYNLTGFKYICYGDPSNFAGTEYKQLKLYMVYKTTNKINGKIYIGVHGDHSLENSYRGSGDAVRPALKKYGTENFDIEILKIFTNEDSAYSYEEFLVDDEFIKREDTYNLRKGGRWGSNNGLKGLRRVTNGEVELRLRSPHHEEKVKEEGWEYGDLKSYGKVIIPSLPEHAHRLSKIHYFKDPKGNITKIYNLEVFCKLNPHLDVGNMREVKAGKYIDHRGWSKCTDKEIADFISFT